MRKLCGVWLLVTTGCATQPAVADRTESEAVTAQANTDLPIPSGPSAELRVGVEYLPAETRHGVELDRSGLDHGHKAASSPAFSASRPITGWNPMPSRLVDDVVVLGALGHTSPMEAEVPTGTRLKNTEERGWILDKDKISLIDDTVERIGVRFVRETLGGDRRRADRLLGTAFQMNHPDLMFDSAPLTYVDRRNIEQDQIRLKRYGTRLLRRSGRRSLKELRIVSDVERMLRKLKAVHVPLTDEGYRRSRGKLSLHMRGDLSDPLEVFFVRNGWKVGGGLQEAQLSYRTRLTKRMTFEVKTSWLYHDQAAELLGRITFEITDATTLNLSAGSDVTILTSPKTYTGLPPDDDESAGLLFYVEHLF